VTHDLRWHWGLDTVLSVGVNPEKNRLDHRHHAIDAIVVALTDRKRLFALSQTDRALGTRRKVLDPPHKDFIAEVEAAVKQINVSHRIRARARGLLHHEKPLHKTKKKDVFAVRKLLKDLTWNEISNIRDNRVRELIEDRLRQYRKAARGNGTSAEAVSGDSETAVKKPPAEAWKKPIYVVGRSGAKAPTGAVIKSVRVESKDATVRPIREKTPHQVYVKPASNHHFVLFTGIVPGPDEPDLHSVDAITVSLLEAARRSCDGSGRPVIRHEFAGHLNARRAHPEAKFWMSLCPGEMLLLNPADRASLYRFETAAGTSRQFVLRKHFAAAVGSSGKTAPRPWTLPPTVRKVVVDPIGRVRWAND
jgi:CRISPR-associated endonuclease Csn1